VQHTSLEGGKNVPLETFTMFTISSGFTVLAVVFTVAYVAINQQNKNQQRQIDELKQELEQIKSRLETK
jgi:sensor domain CHASE-containing protein